MTKVQKKINSKIGPLYLVASESGLHGVFWSDQKIAQPSKKSSSQAAIAILNQAALEIKEYLDGQRTHFDLPLTPEGTAFQKRVWTCLQKIPYGSTKSYKEIAIELANKNASRAVGTANAHNPLCLIVPCHRVISSDGSLGGYSGGLELKQRLLNLEKGKPKQGV